MYVLDNGDVRDQIAADVANVQLGGHPFKQDMRCVLHQEPGAAQHQQPNHD